MADATFSQAELLAEQAEYYRARAPEYDGWFERRGRYDRGEAATAQWFAEVDDVRRAFDALPLDGADVIELAPGTGIWTERLVDRVGHLTAVDASAEMIAENRTRLGARSDSVTYVQADLFAWQPERVYDVVVFCFWISHVPEARLEEFLGTVRSMLTVGGSVFFLDGRREPSSTAGDHQLPGPDTEVMTRRLDDGREFRIVKSFRGASNLEARFAAAGLDVGVLETATYFQYGTGIRLPAEPHPG